jgi:hypothetical protein
MHACHFVTLRPECYIAFSETQAPARALGTAPPLDSRPHPPRFIASHHAAAVWNRSRNVLGTPSDRPSVVLRRGSIASTYEFHEEISGVAPIR